METNSHPSKADRERLFLRLYQQAFPAVAKYVSKRGGNLEQTKDLFQEALVIYYEKAVLGETALQNSETAYLVGICKHLWFQLCANGKSTCELNGQDFALLEEEKEIAANKLLALLQTSGKKCLDMLKSFYYDKLNMAQLAETFDYATERSATVQKYKCLENIRNTVKENQMQYEDFLA